MYCGQMQLCVCVQRMCSWCLKDVASYMMTLRAINHKTTVLLPAPSAVSVPVISLPLSKLHHVGIFNKPNPGVPFLHPICWEQASSLSLLQSTDQAQPRA